MGIQNSLAWCCVFQQITALKNPLPYFVLVASIIVTIYTYTVLGFFTVLKTPSGYEKSYVFFSGGGGFLFCFVFVKLKKKKKRQDQTPVLTSFLRLFLHQEHKVLSSKKVSSVAC